MIVDYEACREDLRALEAMQVQLLGFAIASVSFLGWVMSRDCRLGNLWTGQQCGSGTDSIYLPAPLLAAAPLVPLGLAAYIVFNGISLVMRSFYGRSLEREIRAEMVRSGGSETNVAKETGDPPNAFLSSEIEAESGRMSRPGAIQAPLAWVTMLTVLVLFGGFLALVIYVLPSPWQVPTFCAYAVASIPIFRGARIGIHGRSLFIHLWKSANRAAGQPLTADSPAVPSRWLFNILPRRGLDSLLKGVFIILGGAGPLLTQDINHVAVATRASLVTGFEVLVLFEFLAYQARYLINDLRGFDEDKLHPAANFRRRLSYFFPDIDDAIQVALRGIAVRLLLVGLLSTMLPVPLMWWVLLSTAAMLISGAIYDTLRDQKPGERLTTRQLSFLIHALVGMGYAIRAVLGAATVSTVAQKPLNCSFYLFIAGYFWILGIAFCALSWTFHAVARTDLVTGAAARPPKRIRVNTALWTKPHLRGQLAFLNIQPAAPTVVEVDDGALPGSTARFLLDGDGLSASRLIPAIVSVCVGTLATALMMRTPTIGSLLLTLAGALAGYCLARAPRKGRIASVVLLGVAMFAASVGWMHGADPAAAPIRLLLLQLPWLLAVGIQWYFREQSLWSIVQRPREVLKTFQSIAHTALLRTARFLLGAKAADWLLQGSRSGGSRRAPRPQAVSSCGS